MDNRTYFQSDPRQNQYPQNQPMNQYPMRNERIEAIPNPAYHNQDVGPSYLRGRVVNAFNEVAPNEVPMDGTFSVFILRDLSAICLKAWNGMGTIDSRIYSINNDNVLTGGIADLDLSPITQRLDKIESYLTNPQASTNQRAWQGQNKNKKTQDSVEGGVQNGQ